MWFCSKKEFELSLKRVEGVGLEFEKECAAEERREKKEREKGERKVPERGVFLRGGDFISFLFGCVITMPRCDPLFAHFQVRGCVRVIGQGPGVWTALGRRYVPARLGVERDGLKMRNTHLGNGGAIVNGLATDHKVELLRCENSMSIWFAKPAIVRKVNMPRQWF